MDENNKPTESQSGADKPQAALPPPKKGSAGKTVALIIVAAVIVGVIAFAVRAPEEGADKSDLIRVFSPEPNETVASPLTLSGEARGTWYFEASFPVRIIDDAGNELGVVPAQAQGEWMTEEFVPFAATLTFTEPATLGGTLIFEKDNPSGLPEFDDEFRIPVRFAVEEGNGNTNGNTNGATTGTTTNSGTNGTNVGTGAVMTVTAYFGSNTLNPGAQDCSLVYPVTRTVPKTQAVARASLLELLEGPTASEKTEGYITSLNDGVVIQSLTIQNGVARVDFSSRLDESIGGSCRVQAIRSQITKTLTQFSTVQSVVISVDGRTDDILQP